MFVNESDLYPYSVSDFSARDALVIAPHPDDESLGCGGSIAKHVKAGSRVKVLFLTDGEQGDFEDRFGSDYVGMRKSAALQAMETLGVHDCEFLGFRDRDLHRALDEISDRLLHELESFSPTLIYVPSPYEVHPDHRSAFMAMWKLMERKPMPLLVYEVIMPIFPNFLVDITAEIDTKRRAIACYTTEVYYNDYLAKVEGLNRFRTATLPENVTYAEAFLLTDNLTADSLSLRLLKTAAGFHGG
jgi:LmbE family N-acetylglucosaminyl deacetylase